MVTVKIGGVVASEDLYGYCGTNGVTMPPDLVSFESNEWSARAAYNMTSMTKEQTVATSDYVKAGMASFVTGSFYSDISSSEITGSGYYITNQN